MCRSILERLHSWFAKLKLTDLHLNLVSIMHCCIQSTLEVAWTVFWINFFMLYLGTVSNNQARLHKASIVSVEHIFWAYIVKTGNWERLNATGFWAALELKSIQSPVSKLTDWQFEMESHLFKQSVNFSIPGNVASVWEGDEYT